MTELKSIKRSRKKGAVKIGSLNIAYTHLIGGENTIIFIHGNSAGKEVFEPQFEGLAESDYSLLAIDLPGHGESSNSSSPSEDYNFCSFALLIKKVCEALDISTPLVVGWSLGGHVVIEMAGRGFDMAGAMIFGAPPIGPGFDEFEAAFLPSEAMAVTLNPVPSAEDIKTYVGGLYGSLSNIPGRFYDLAGRTDGALREHLGAHWASGDYGCHQQTVVAGWNKPLCVIHGEADVFASGAFISGLRWQNLWKDEIISMPNIGHAPFIEAPEEFNATLLEFADDVFQSGAAS